MKASIKILMAAAAVIVIALIGINLVPRSGVGGPSSTPVPTATPAPTPSPTPAPTLPPSGQLAPGTYRSNFGSGPYITLTLPAGWSSDPNVVGKPGADPPNGMVINTWPNIGTVYNDPCHWQTTAVSVGPTVDAVVTALVAQKRGSAVTPVDVTIDGFHGKEIDLLVPLSVTFDAPSSASQCDGRLYKPWTLADGQSDRYNQGAGQHDLLDILDVNGQTLAIKRSFYAVNTAADRAELQAIIDSIKITP